MSVTWPGHHCCKKERKVSYNTLMHNIMVLHKSSKILILLSCLFSVRLQLHPTIIVWMCVGSELSLRRSRSGHYFSDGWYRSWEWMMDLFQRVLSLSYVILYTVFCCTIVVNFVYIVEYLIGVRFLAYFGWHSYQ